MATKLSKVQVEKMNDLDLGFTAKTEEQAREQLLEWLEAHGLPGMEQETFDNLLDIVGSMSSISSDEAQVAAPNFAEAEADELAKEAAEEEAEADDDEEEEEVPAPAEAVEAEEEKPAAKEKTAPAKKKAAKAAKKPAANKCGVRLVPQKSKEDLAKLQELLGDLFPTDKYEYVPVSRGISIKYRGTNSKQVAIMFENVYLKDGEPSTTNVVLNAFRNQTLQDKLTDDGVQFDQTWNALPLFKNIDWNEALELVGNYMSDIQQVVANTDNRLGRNRAKMEEGLKANDKKPAKKAAAPVAKKAAPAPAAKKAASKAEAKAEPTEDPKAKARAALLKAAAAKKAKASKK